MRSRNTFVGVPVAPAVNRRQGVCVCGQQYQECHRDVNFPHLDSFESEHLFNLWKEIILKQDL